MSWRNSKALTIHFSTLIVMRSREAIKAFYKVTWHKNTGRTERERGVISKENHETLLPSLFLFSNLVYLHLLACRWETCVLRCAEETVWAAWRSKFIIFLTWASSRKAKNFFSTGDWEREGYSNVPPLEETKVHIFPPLYLMYHTLSCFSLQRETLISCQV